MILARLGSGRAKTFPGMSGPVHGPLEGGENNQVDRDTPFNSAKIPTTVQGRYREKMRVMDDTTLSLTVSFV